MDSASEPPSPMAAAASDKRKLRTCSNCTGRMPSIDFDTHTLCIGCRNQVSDLNVYCDECRDWPDTKRAAFVKYNRTLKAKRDYKARLSAARSSDQSVYDTDTDVPSIDEPSVPVKDANLDCVGSQECVVSESGGLSEAGPSEVLYVTSGDSLEQLASCILSKMNELQSDRGRLPPVQSHSIVGSGSRPIVAATDYLGVSAPLRGFIYLTLSTQFSGSPRRLCLTKPLIIGCSPAITRSRIWRKPSLPLVWRSARFAIGGFNPLNRFWSMTGVSRLDRVRNEVVRARTGVRRELAARVDVNVLRWFGHVERMDNERLLKKVMNAKVDGRSARGSLGLGGWME